MNVSTAYDKFIINAKNILKKKQFKVHDETQFRRGNSDFIFFIQDNSQNELMVKAIILNQGIEGDQISTQLLSYCTQEALILSNLTHSSILQYVSHFQEGKIFFIIMERSLLTLQDYLLNNFSSNNENDNNNKNNNQKKNISDEQFFDIAGQLIDGIEYLHKKGIILQNVNPSNIFVFSKEQLKLSVLRLTQSLSPLFEKDKSKPRSSFKDSFMYFPPEIMQIINSSEINKDSLKKKKIKKTTKSNIWALGIILLQMLGTQKYILISLSCGYSEFTEEPNASLKINQFLKFLMKKISDERPDIETIREKLCKLDPKYHSKVLMKRAIWSRDKELDFDEAESFLRRAIEEDPTNSYAYSNLALSLQRRQNSYLQSSIKENIEIALQLNPNNEDAIVLSSLQIKDEQKQEEMKFKALSINNKNPYVLNSIGNFFKEKKKYQKSEQFYQLALKADKNFGRAYCCLGNLFEGEQKYGSTIKQSYLGIGRDIADSLMITYIGKIFVENLNEQSLGEKYLNFSIQLNPRCLYSKYELGKYFYYDLNASEKALPYFEEIILACPGNSDYQFQLANTLWSLKRFPEAEVHVKEAIKISLKKVYLQLMGKIAGDQNKIQECISTFEQAIGLFPNNANLHYYYAGYLFKFRKYNESISQYQRSEELEHDELNAENISRINLLLNLNENW